MRAPLRARRVRERAVHRAVRRALRFAALAWALGALPASGQERGPSITWIARDDLADAAVAVADPVRPVVFYNPITFRRLGPALASFVRAHETAHIVLRHMPDSVARMPRAKRESAYRAAELAADCRAARTLAADDPGALRAAIDYFSARGPERMSRLYPMGRERASVLIRCGGLSEAGGVDRVPGA